MIKTPIQFKLESFVDDEIDPIIPTPIPLTSANELDLITTPIILASRFYLVIKPPQNNRNDSSYIPKPFTYYIPWQGIYRNEVRLTLPPTVGWGEGSCYEVEYWEWTPIILPSLGIKSPLKRKLLKKEFWLIPSPNKTFLINYNYSNSNSNNNNNTYRFKQESLTLISTGVPISLLSYKDIVVINAIVGLEQFIVTPVISVNTTLIERAVNYKNTTDVLLTTTIATDLPITISYVKPIDITCILFKNSLFPQNIYMNELSTSFSHY
jgi:hypothetical protein